MQDTVIHTMVEILIVGVLHQVFLHSMCWSYLLKKSLQPIAILSTTEVEYIAAIEGVKEATWLKGLLTKLGVSQGITTAFSNSQSAI